MGETWKEHMARMHDKYSHLPNYLGNMVDKPKEAEVAPPSDPRLTELEGRREFNAGKQIDNARLPAGASMYYYCECCGAHVATKPEGWWQDPPPKFCADCKDLIKDGVVSYKNTYGDWLDENDKERYAASG